VDYEQKFDFFKTRKNSSTGPLCITDPEYGGYDKEIRCFSQFTTEADDFR
jgi:hypothetical protein